MELLYTFSCEIALSAFQTVAPCHPQLFVLFLCVLFYSCAGLGMLELHTVKSTMQKQIEDKMYNQGHATYWCASLLGDRLVLLHQLAAPTYIMGIAWMFDNLQSEFLALDERLHMCG